MKARPLTIRRLIAVLFSKCVGQSSEPGLGEPINCDLLTSIDDRPTIFPFDGTEEGLSTELRVMYLAFVVPLRSYSEETCPPLISVDTLVSGTKIHMACQSDLRVQLVVDHRVDGAWRCFPRAQWRLPSIDPLLMTHIGSTDRHIQVVPTSTSKDVRSLGNSVSDTAVAIDDIVCKVFARFEVDLTGHNDNGYACLLIEDLAISDKVGGGYPYFAGRVIKEELQSRMKVTQDQPSCAGSTSRPCRAVKRQDRLAS